MSAVEEELCELDQQNETWHREHQVQHSFSPRGELHKRPPEKPKRPALRGDPALRALLISKGLITEAELVAASETLFKVLGVGNVMDV